MDHPSFTLGIEEEYLLVDKASRDLVREAPDALMVACEKTLEGQVSPEFLRCQIEVATRIDIFNQVTYFLPHLLALTTSSPFWQGIDTGLNSYRLIVFDALPRTGFRKGRRWRLSRRMSARAKERYLANSRKSAY